MMSRLPKIATVTLIGLHSLDICFDNGISAQWHADLSEFFGPMGEPLRDPSYFARVFVENGALVWPNGFDAAPDALYRDLVKPTSSKMVAAE
jgi:Protein of unknown function (DUF2442)